MRRSAAALLARPSPAPPPPPLVGLEAVRAAAAAAMLEVDVKLSAVLAAVSGGLDATAVSSIHCTAPPTLTAMGSILRRCGSEPELAAAAADADDADEDASALFTSRGGVRERWRAAAHLSCPSLPQAPSRPSAAGLGPDALAAPAQPAAAGLQGRGGDGGTCGRTPGPWRLLPPALPPVLRADAGGGSGTSASGTSGGLRAGGTLAPAKIGDPPQAADGDDGVVVPERARRWRESSFCASCPALFADGGRGGGVGSEAFEGYSGADGGSGGLSPRGPGPMLGRRSEL